MSKRNRPGRNVTTKGESKEGAPEVAEAPKGFRISMRPEEAVLWLSLLEYRSREYRKHLPKRELVDADLPEGMTAIDNLFGALALPSRSETGRPDIEGWVDRLVGDAVRVDALEVLPPWLRASSRFRVETTVDVPFRTWDALLTETAICADRDPANNEELWSFLTVRNCDLGNYNGHQVLWEDLLGGILRALHETSVTNLVAFDAWARGSGRPFPLWREIALLAWTRALANDS